jgi:hypothetical protein
MGIAKLRLRLPMETSKVENRIRKSKNETRNADVLARHRDLGDLEALP